VPTLSADGFAEAPSGRRFAPRTRICVLVHLNLVPPVDVELNGTKILIARHEARSRETYFLECLFEAAYGVLNLALYFIGLAVRSQLRVTGRLAGRLTVTMINFDDPSTRSLSSFSFGLKVQVADDRAAI
jgi:hypothetical protein